MALESVSYLDDLVITNPVAGDPRSEGDDHLRNIKTGAKASFPGMTGRAWRVQVKGAGYTIVAGDNMSVLQFSGAYTASYTAAATLGNGHLTVIHASGGAVTIDPDGAELVNGAATLVVPQGSVALVLCDGTGLVVSTQFSSITANRVPYATATNVLGSSANLTFDGTTLTTHTATVSTGLLTASGGLSATTGVFSSTVTLSGTAANMATGANFISYAGTDEGFSLDSGNNATLSGNLTVSGGTETISGASPTLIIKDTQAYSGGAPIPTLVFRGLGFDSADTLFGYFSGRPNVGNADRGFIEIYTRLNGVNTLTATFGTGLALDTTLSGNLTVSGDGPHSFGGAANATVQLILQNTFSSAADAAGFGYVGGLVPAANGFAAGVYIAPGTFQKAGSGTHANFNSFEVRPPTVGADAGSALTNASTVKITSAPTGATNNYALWVAGGTSRFDGTVELNGTAANIATGANFISYAGTDAGFSLDSSNNATLSAQLVVVGQLSCSTTIVTNGGSLAVNSDPDTNAYALDASTSDKQLTDGSQFTLSGGNNFSGFIVVTETQATGETALFICGGGATVLVSQTSIQWDDADTPGVMCIFQSGANVVLKNRNGGTRTFGVAMIRTRTS